MLPPILLKIAGALLLSLTLAGLAAGLVATRSELSATKVSLNEQKAVTDSLRADIGKIRSSVSAVQRISAVTRSDLNAALAAEPAWRDAVVPAGVADSLCKRLRCPKQP